MLSLLVSTKPESVNDRMGVTDFLSAMKYGDRWRLSRRMFHQEFNSTTAWKVEAAQDKYSRSVNCLIFVLHLRKSGTPA